MGGIRLTQEQKNMALRLKRQGLLQRDIAKQLCCTAGAISLIVPGRFRTGVPDTWTPRPERLGALEREQILRGLDASSQATNRSEAA